MSSDFRKVRKVERARSPHEFGLVADADPGPKVWGYALRVDVQDRGHVWYFTSSLDEARYAVRKLPALRGVQHVTVHQGWHRKDAIGETPIMVSPTAFTRVPGSATLQGLDPLSFDPADLPESHPGF